MSEQSPSTAASVLNAADMVQHQPGGIVSRVVMKGKNGNVTLFAFDAGQELSEHTAPFDALVSIVDGEAQITIGGKPHKVSSGELVMMPANVPHAVKAPVAMKMMLVMIKG